MLLYDMDLTALADYRGSTPAPADHDSYWREAVAELDRIDGDPTIVPAGFQTPFASCSSLFFSGTHGARVHARLWRPVQRTRPTPVLLLFHGLSARAPDWTVPLGYVAAGWTVAALDCRGQGGQSQDPGGVTGWTLRGSIMRGLVDDPTQAYYRQVFLDTKRLAETVMGLNDVDATTVAVTGSSQGGGLSLAAAALEPRITHCAPVFPYLCDYQRVWELGLAEGAYGDIRDWFRRFDPTHSRQGEVFEKLGYIDVVNLAHRIRARVSMTVALSDRVCPPSTQYAAFNRLRSSRRMRVYPDFGHERLPENDEAIWDFLHSDVVTP